MVLLFFGGGTLTSIVMLVLLFYVVLIMTWGTYHATVIRIAQNAEQGRDERLGQAISVCLQSGGGADPCRGADLALHVGPGAGGQGSGRFG